MRKKKIYLNQIYEEYNISKTQFYYHIRRVDAASNASTPIFQIILLNGEVSIDK